MATSVALGIGGWRLRKMWDSYDRNGPKEERVYCHTGRGTSYATLTYPFTVLYGLRNDGLSRSITPSPIPAPTHNPGIPRFTATGAIGTPHFKGYEPCTSAARSYRGGGPVDCSISGAKDEGIRDERFWEKGGPEERGWQSTLSRRPHFNVTIDTYRESSN
ncbi:hypothetical protein N7497_008005 [Penicillium chrysogenum]|nr:hypothetical protein N7497_008005 [Penicillium chrysogenum]